MNDQIFSFRLSCEMVAQHWMLDPEISHESPHAMLIFKISKQLPRLKIKTIQFPDDKDGIKLLGEEIANEIDRGIGSRLDILYNAIKAASKTCNLIRKYKSYSKLKF